jgi:hypothetical protein
MSIEDGSGDSGEAVGGEEDVVEIARRREAREDVVEELVRECE